MKLKEKTSISYIYIMEEPNTNIIQLKKEKYRQYYIKNKDAILTKQKEYYNNNKEKNINKNHERVALNPEQRKKQNSCYYASKKKYYWNKQS